ncbi:pyridoxamine 5'-phosphate oxidase family protein [Chitinophaga pinensis]|uniref:Pyridoxamine 5'-phosphate oxidase-related FMN-binding n=1 Tax=Chitinophaga pinensis (strain ATCC 43595 / DSM 2588 / LMG 13176 / NBRC 15968 / NCIMB 11800 / UQM 2034) TaxID=485918 RepID=A0A979FZ52_CHIPD|nr:pyridoxamine 5'-phosphate oxidase family protein [Chitinophaga pinensis]ACU57764.1 pyridoxamine 5'-phosphate oxidase-related FMN- binding [Chitinophaga pinensis DSM 2588]
MNYSSLAFTDAVRDMQEKLGSRKSYARLENRNYVDGLTENEMAFISDRDSFYMATIGENGYPYIQHRGGPKGFVKVLNATQMGIIDYKGNAQYITVGNITDNNHVSVIMVDYPTRTRLKLYASARIVELEDDPVLYEQLRTDGYQFRPERMMLFDIDAYDWNCPQHITPRYSLEEINKAFASQRQYILQLETELKKLKERPVADE